MGVRYSICVTGSQQTFCCTRNKSTRKIWNTEDKTDVDDIQSSESGRAQGLPEVQEQCSSCLCEGK